MDSNQENNAFVEETLPEEVEIIGISFRGAGKIYYFAANGNTASVGEHAIVETARGMEYGDVTLGNTMVRRETIVLPLKNVIRVADKNDDLRFETNREKEKDAFEICQKKILDHKLDMKLVDVEYTFDNSKLLFYFTSDDRVDFRELVKDLAGHFRTRIELRQIGIRDEAKIMGGLGICGRPFCCSSFLPDFVQVSIKMAKEQSLSLNAAKISGACGRLMCCLRYEYDTYQEETRKMPKVDTTVMTPDGIGVVTEIKPLLSKVKVMLSDGSEKVPKLYPLSALRPYDKNAPKAEAETVARTAESVPENKDAGEKERRSRRADHKKQEAARKEAIPAVKEPVTGEAAGGEEELEKTKNGEGESKRRNRSRHRRSKGNNEGERLAEMPTAADAACDGQAADGKENRSKENEGENRDKSRRDRPRNGNRSNRSNAGGNAIGDTAGRNGGMKTENKNTGGENPGDGRRNGEGERQGQPRNGRNRRNRNGNRNDGSAPTEGQTSVGEKGGTGESGRENGQKNRRPADARPPRNRGERSPGADTGAPRPEPVGSGETQGRPEQAGKSEKGERPRYSPMPSNAVKRPRRSGMSRITTKPSGFNGKNGSGDGKK